MEESRARVRTDIAYPMLNVQVGESAIATSRPLATFVILTLAASKPPLSVPLAE
jgi:hypothetical protein